MQKHAGFTLVELSIVLVIIGLMVGGALVATDLKRSAELSALISDFTKYEKAFRSFEEMYNSKPGDMSDASDYWAACIDDPTEPTNTCNGDGDMVINAKGEGFRAWQHLSLANLIEGDYTGFYATGADAIDPDENLPESVITPGLYYFFEDSTTRHIGFGQRDSNTTDDSWPYEVMLSPQELYRFDLKFDDGKPNSGKITANEGWQVARVCRNVATNSYQSTVEVVSLNGNGSGCLVQYQMD